MQCQVWRQSYFSLKSAQFLLISDHCTKSMSIVSPFLSSANICFLSHLLSLEWLECHIWFTCLFCVQILYLIRFHPLEKLLYSLLSANSLDYICSTFTGIICKLLHSRKSYSVAVQKRHRHQKLKLVARLDYITQIDLKKEIN